MRLDWQALTRLSGGQPLLVERVRLRDANVAIEGLFEPPPLAQLRAEDQVFVAAFVRCHGSIKQMESYFGVSYPSIKNRLNQIGAQLPFVESEAQAEEPELGALDRLERGEISANEAIAELKREREKRR
jgi:hypothetical protein